MTQPKKEAKKLVLLFYQHCNEETGNGLAALSNEDWESAKLCAEIAVDFTIGQVKCTVHDHTQIIWLNDCKTEILKL